MTRRSLECAGPVGHRSGGMDREALLALDKPALVELLLELVASYEARLAEQQQRIVELEARLAKLEGPPKTPGNSSVPPSQGQNPTAPSDVERSAGHGEATLGPVASAPSRDLQVACRPERVGAVRRSCRRRSAAGGAALPAGQVSWSSYPVVQALVLELRQYRADCANCGTRTLGELPPGFDRRGPERSEWIGPRVERCWRISTKASMSAMSGWQPSVATVRAADQRRRHRRGARTSRHRGRPRGGADSGAGARQSGDQQRRDRGAGERQGLVPLGLPDPHGQLPRPGANPSPAGDRRVLSWCEARGLGLGRLRGPARGAGRAHQICLSHQIRDLTLPRSRSTPKRRMGRRSALGAAAPSCLRARDPPASAARHAHRRAVRASPDAGAEGRRAADLRTAAGRRGGLELQRRYRKHWSSLFVFLERDDVEPTNNSSEQDLRPAVVHRKVSGGYRSEAGAERGAIDATLLATARKTGQNVFELFCRLAGPSPPAAAGLPS